MFFSCCLAVFSDHKEKLKFYGSFVFAPLACWQLSKAKFISFLIPNENLDIS